MANSNPYWIVRSRRIEKELRKIHRTNVRDLTNPFEIPDIEFIGLFRANKEMALYICSELAAVLAPANGMGLPVHIKVLACLRLLSDGNYQRGTGQDHGVVIGQTTVSKYMTQFCDAVLRILLHQWIRFPGTEPTRRSVADGFRERFGMDHVIGVIDCTHVAIFPPKKPQSIQYKNHKGFHSLNVQLTADAECRILNVVARYPGRVHDSFIFHNSAIKNELSHLYETGHLNGYFLLGDSGYGLAPWLMTPIVNAETGSPEHRYTQWHCRTRNVIERTNGYIKTSFRILGHDRVIHYAPEKASKIIYTCCTLYNIMKYFRVPHPYVASDAPAVPEEGPLPLPAHPTDVYRAGQTRRQEIVDTHFLVG